VELEFTGLPLPGVWARFSDSVTGGKFWQVAIPSALGATLAAMLLYGLIWGYRPTLATTSPGQDSQLLDTAERAEVVHAVAALDQQYEEGDVPEAEYRAQRRELMSRVLDPAAQKEP
jgi:hypothetical protein